LPGNTGSERNAFQAYLYVPKSMDREEERLSGIPLCPKSMDREEERLSGIPLCPKKHGQGRGKERAIYGSLF